MVGHEVPASGKEGCAVGLACATGELVGLAVAVAVGVGVGVAVGVLVGLLVGVAVGEPVGVAVAVGVAVGLPVGVVRVKVRAVQAWGAAASGLLSGAVGATACCLSW